MCVSVGADPRRSPGIWLKSLLSSRKVSRWFSYIKHRGHSARGVVFRIANTLAIFFLGAVI
jgi:hypothetical protein